MTETQPIVSRGVYLALLVATVAGRRFEGQTTAGAEAGLVLRLVADVPLPGEPGRFDYQSLDPMTGRLYIAHMGTGEVIAFDTRTRQVTGTAGGLPKATGILAVPRLHRVYVSAAGSHALAILNYSTLATISIVKGITCPDGIAFAD